MYSVLDGKRKLLVPFLCAEEAVYPLIILSNPTEMAAAKERQILYELVMNIRSCYDRC